ncbi:MAG: sigma-54-dependent Fis family transcriptional regulator [Deltaproteobacteria bacterium]|nr:sigma-54-dependent Fis family transcriptional regulator [Deltaproteobacteria bacterium]
MLVVDDEPNIRTTFSRALDLEGFAVRTAEDAGTALEAVDEFKPDLVLLDLRLPDQDGLWVLEQLATLDEAPPVIMMSGHGTLESAIKATRLGALDFLEKPVQIDRLLITVRNVLKLDELDKQVSVLRRSVVRRHGMVGDSPALHRVIEAIRRAAPTQARVLITGESGVGKELVARAIHDLSRRAAGPFNKLNCAAIPENLVESELFGHERGAFTGAERRRLGRFERADGGTLFLDEIGEMPLSLQARLLRVLQEGELERVGGSTVIPVDVRVIAATNRDLSEEIAAGRFREDLYYRLAVLPIAVPPLRSRLSDVPALATALLSGACTQHDLPPIEWTDEALRALQRHDWPGNVRELGNLVDRLAILSRDALIRGDDVRTALPGAAPLLGPSIPEEGALYELLESFERRIIEDRIARFDGNMTQAATDLGLERSHLYKKVKRLGIRRED